MRSYAQHAEDVRLARALGAKGAGFWVDVGAAHPRADSVTMLFAERGWRGINIEPDPAAFALLTAARPHDINLNVACSDTGGEGVLYSSGIVDGWATLDEDVVDVVARDRSRQLLPQPIQRVTLAEVWAEHVHEPVDFLKIDVEGHERAVIAGAQWEVHRPRVVVVEATRPHSIEPTHEKWEPLLLAAGYRAAGFDGINRFYAAEECAELVPLLEAPVTPLDEVEPDRFLSQIDDLHARLSAAEADAARSRDAAASAERALHDREQRSLRVPAPVVRAVRRAGSALRSRRS